MSIEPKSDFAPSVELRYESTTGLLLLVARAADVFRKPVLAVWLREHKANFIDEFRCTVAVPEANLQDRFNSLEKILGYLGIHSEIAEDTAAELSEAENQARSFEEFSRKALAIWQSDVDTDELRDFLAVVDERCPSRKLYRRQALSAFHLAFSQNACNFSVPGAGKTAVVLAAYAYLSSLDPADARSVNSLLVVGPLSSFKAWEDEFRAMFGRSARSVRLSGSSLAVDKSSFLRNIDPKAATTELVLCSYQTMASLEDDFTSYLKNSKRRTMIVLDEAHYVKRFDGYWANAALSLASLAQSRVVLTGTPAPNGYEDLYNLFKFVYPDRNLVGFSRQALKAMNRGNRMSAVQILTDRIQPFYTRIRKADLGLPEPQQRVQNVNMSSIHQTIYQNLERRVVPGLVRHLDQDASPVRVRARLIRLRQAASNPALLRIPLEDDGLFDNLGDEDFTVAELETSELILAFDPNTDLIRLQELERLTMEVLRDQRKVLIWSYFLGNVALIESRFREKADFVRVLTGSTPTMDVYGEDAEDLQSREAIIDGFHSIDGTAILIANPQAVGESISLHKACSTAIYFDRDFNAGKFIQSKDRIHRYDPNGGSIVNYHYLESPGTVDSDIGARLAIKEQRLLKLFDSSEIPLFTSAFDDERADIRMVLESYELRNHQ